MRQRLKECERRDVADSIEVVIAPKVFLFLSPGKGVGPNDGGERSYLLFPLIFWERRKKEKNGKTRKMSPGEIEISITGGSAYQEK